MLLPDQVQPKVFDDDVAPNFEPDSRVALRARLQHPLQAIVKPGEANNVIMVAPKGPGHIVRRLYTQGLRRRRR